MRRSLLAAGVAARLDPGVLTVRQAADRVASGRLDGRAPLGGTARDALLAELAATLGRGEGFAPLAPLLSAPGGRRYLADNFRRLRLAGKSPAQADALLRAESGDDAGRALGRLYRSYVEALQRGALADEAARLEHACDSLDAFAAPRGLILDLTAPVSPVEKRLVDRLAERAGWVALPLPDAPAGAPLLREAVRSRRESWPVAPDAAPAAEPPPLRADASSTSPPAGLRAIARHLFDDQAAPSADATGVEVLAARSDRDAARRTARRVKELLLAGAAPDDVVVAVPSPDAYLPLLRRELDEYGVPCWFAERRPLGGAPLVQAMLRLLGVLESDGAFDALVTLLARADLPGLAPGAAPEGFASGVAAAEWFVREAQAPSGLAGLQRHAAAVADNASGRPRKELARAARAALGLFERLRAAADGLPEEATPLEWVDAAVAVVRTLQDPQSAALASGAEAFEALEGAAASVEWLDRWRKRPVSTWRRPDFYSRLREWASRVKLPPASTPDGRVRVVGASTALGLPCGWLLVAGASEEAFRPPAGSPPAEAMLRFYELSTLPREGLAFLYAELDDAAQPLAPSPYVEDIQRLFTPEALQPSAGEPGAEGDALSPREWRRQASLAAVRGDAAPLAAVVAATGPALQRGLTAVCERSRGDHFGPWEGVLGPAAAAELTNHYDAQHLWSASQLELVATCPYKFFAKHVLKMAPPGELNLEVNHRRRGSLMHDALAAALTAGGGLAPAGRPLSDAGRALGELLLEHVARLGATDRAAPHQAALVAIEARQAREWAARYADQQAGFDTEKRFATLDRPLRPTLLEARFGPGSTDDSPEDAASVDTPLELPLPSGEVLRVVGRIDRIDVGAMGDCTLFAVIDYKTAKQLRASVDHITSGKQLQPVLYALAAQRLFLSEEAIPIAAGYWGVREKGFVGPKVKELPMIDFVDGRARPSGEWSALVASALETAGELVAAVRGGSFPMLNDDEHCGAMCEFKTVCRVAQTRSLGKTPRPAEGESP
ncbi:PD-(D/E)XK nuclease family protein [Botrimarina sp.]|uniref:PD-(D/E)XK nuclease family protein n=1 Tax=Botrimarina sp. TaxID=2795802 RepID=UPI0032ED3215